MELAALELVDRDLVSQGRLEVVKVNPPPKSGYERQADDLCPDFTIISIVRNSCIFRRLISLPLGDRGGHFQTSPDCLLSFQFQHTSKSPENGLQ